MSRKKTKIEVGESNSFTLLFRKASAKYWVPSDPISLWKSESLVSVCVKYEYQNSRDRKRKKFTVLFFNISARYLAASTSIQFESRLSVVSVCVRKVNMKVKEMEKGRKKFTILFCKPSTKFCNPWSPMWELVERLSVLSVYVKCDYKNSRDKQKQNFTVLFFKISARCLAPSASIPVSFSSSVVSVCVGKVNMKMKDRSLPYYFVEHQSDIVSLRLYIIES